MRIGDGHLGGRSRPRPPRLPCACEGSRQPSPRSAAVEALHAPGARGERSAAPQRGARCGAAVADRPRTPGGCCISHSGCTRSARACLTRACRTRAGTARGPGAHGDASPRAICHAPSSSTAAASPRATRSTAAVKALRAAGLQRGPGQCRRRRARVRRAGTDAAAARRRAARCGRTQLREAAVAVSDQDASQPPAGAPRLLRARRLRGCRAAATARCAPRMR